MLLLPRIGDIQKQPLDFEVTKKFRGLLDREKYTDFTYLQVYLTACAPAT